MDNRNVIEEIFNNIQTKPIGLIEAIQENYLPNPEYHCGLYEITTKEKERILKLNDEPLKNQILNYDIDESIENIFKENLDLNQNHKIICFVDKINNIDEGIINVKKWIKKDINIYKIHSKQSKVINENQIKEFQITNGINIMFAVNMLNEGVHFSGVDVVIFLRKTSSNIIYFQQFGRVLSDLVKNPKIFDLVNNINNLGNGYAQMISKRADELKIKSELKTKTGETLKVITHQIDLIKALEKGLSNDYYSEEEDNILKKYHKEKSIKQLSSLLPNRTEASIKHRLRYLGLPYIDDNQRKRFTKEEDNVLLGKYESNTIEELAEELNRCYGSILSRCKYLKINPISSNEKMQAFKENIIVEKLKTIEGNVNISEFAMNIAYLSTDDFDLMIKLDKQNKLTYETKRQEQFIIDLKSELYSPEELSEKYGYSIRSIIRRGHEFGLFYQEKEDYESIIPKIKDLRDKGYTFVKISEKLGISIDIIKRLSSKDPKIKMGKLDQYQNLMDRKSEIFYKHDILKMKWTEIAEEIGETKQRMKGFIRRERKKNNGRESNNR